MCVRGEDEGAKLRRRGEICFSKAAWRLTEIDGQLGIADINISNFLFTRSSMSDDRYVSSFCICTVQAPCIQYRHLILVHDALQVAKRHREVLQRL